MECDKSYRDLVECNVAHNCHQGMLYVYVVTAVP